jgi:L-ascorbate metabolism protein UlaG (beta-lactamase superfamily)
MRTDLPPLRTAAVLGITVAALATWPACGSKSTAPSPSPAPSPFVITTPQANSVTYVANSGVLIWAGGRKVLIDALFDDLPGLVVPAAVRTPLVNGQAPCDAIDLVLATHSDADHFAPGPVVQCLEHNPQASFIGPPDTVAQLGALAGRTSSIQVAEGQRARLDVNGIQIEAMFLSHGARGPVNVGYLVSLGGRKFFHTGDVSTNDANAVYLQTLGLPADHVDVAFVPYFYLWPPDPIASQGIQPRFIVPIHLMGANVDWDSILRAFPNVVPLRSALDSWVVQ